VFVRLFVTQKAKVGMTERAGVLSLEDMKGYKAVNRKHVNTTYRGSTIIGMGSPSSGGIAIAQVRTEFVLI
jgi:gamma-glutamyltranspeptidase / glutathione hydrolase